MSLKSDQLEILLSLRVQISPKFLDRCACGGGGRGDRVGSIQLHSLLLYIFQYTISNLATQVQSRVWSCYYINVGSRGSQLEI